MPKKSPLTPSNRNTRDLLLLQTKAVLQGCHGGFPPGTSHKSLGWPVHVGCIRP